MSFLDIEPREEEWPDYVQRDSGVLVPSDVAVDLIREQKRTSAVDLFSGCGGFSLGVMQAGMEVLAAVEWDALAAITYAANLCRWGEMQFHFLSPQDEEKMERALQKEWKRMGKTDIADVPFAGQGWIAAHPDVPAVKHLIIGDIHLLTGKQLLEWIGLKPGELGCMFGSPPCQGFSTANVKRTDDDPRNDLCFEFARLVVETMPLTICLENVPGFAKSPKFVRFIEILKQGGFHGVEALEELAKKPGRVVAHKHRRGIEKAKKKK